ncbi:L,D-transpeptidase [Pseudonocardia sp. D17]|uniref:L,D-transpeptidase n=1 Tax=Pseudonocardia sp. D17 TaxID=882661 RepID=UPI002B39D05A|nr:L,D-transpeptidase [Pseudonocardia sp. D17]
MLLKRRTLLTTSVALMVVASVGLAGQAFAGTSAAEAAHAQPLTPGTPCSISARSCVDLETQQAWLIREGKVTRGPIRVASGGNGRETPIGHSLRVYRKDKDHKSQEFRLPNGDPAPMPWAVFFEDGGIAFHAGDPARSSAGCIRLEPSDAEAWYDDLEIGDQVQVVKGSEERAERGLPA